MSALAVEPDADLGFDINAHFPCESTEMCTAEAQGTLIYQCCPTRFNLCVPHYTRWAVLRQAQKVARVAVFCKHCMNYPFIDPKWVLL